jgi:AcrR family transcriptional regulator
MGRRADHQRDELTRIALDMGENLIAEQGMHGLTVRTLMKSIGYSAGTFYNLFANLDDFLTRLAGRTLERLADETRTLHTEPHSKIDTKADFKKMLALYLEFTRRNSNLWQVVMEHRLPGGAQQPRWYRVKVIGVLGLVEKAVQPAFAKMSKQDCKRHALTLWAATQGICSATAAGSLIAMSSSESLALLHAFADVYFAGAQASSEQQA